MSTLPTRDLLNNFLVDPTTIATAASVALKAPLASPVFTGLPQLPSYLKASLPTATAAGQVIYVSNATGASVTGSVCVANAVGAANWIDLTTGIAVV
jgi:hypothetical protein